MPTATVRNPKDFGGRSFASGALPDCTLNAPVTVHVSVGNCELERRDRHPLYWLRKEQGLSLHELGILSGLRAAQIQLYENGMQPRIENAFRLARALGVTVDKLFGIPYKKLARQSDGIR